MSNSLESTLVLCDLDELLLGADGNLTQVAREVLQLYSGRGGKLTVFSQRGPRAVSTILGSVRFGAPALLYGGTLAYNFSAGSGRSLCSFESLPGEFLYKLPSETGLGIALQMRDGSTRVLRMSQGLERHLRQEWTPFLLNSVADINNDEILRVLVYQDDKSIPVLSILQKSLGDFASQIHADKIASDTYALTPCTVPGSMMLDAVCEQSETPLENIVVIANSISMLELVQAAKHSAVSADAPAELRLAAKRVTMTNSTSGAAAEMLYALTKEAEKRG